MAAASTPFQRPPAEPSISQTRIGKVTKGAGQNSTGGSASAVDSAGEERDQHAPPAPGEHDRVGKSAERHERRAALEGASSGESFTAASRIERQFGGRRGVARRGRGAAVRSAAIAVERRDRF